MRITITGSLGNISRPLTETLVKKGHQVIVISSNDVRKEEITALGAFPAIGMLQDIEFLTSTFVGSDVVYLMEPANNNDLFERGLDVVAAKTAIGYFYKEAVERAGVKHLIHLSSNGAHLEKGNGLLAFHYRIENILRELPIDVNITFIRAASFFQNIFYHTNTIKDQNAIFANYPPDLLEPWVSTEDIADAVVDEIENLAQGRKIRYVASEELTPNQLISLLSEAVGKTNIDWIVVSDDQLTQSMIGLGMDSKSAATFVELTACKRRGIMLEEYFKQGSEKFGKRKMKDFITDVFAPAYKTLNHSSLDNVR